MATKIHVYVLTYDGAGYHIGKTGDIHREVADHKRDKIPATAGKRPTLAWARRTRTFQEASQIEAQLRQFRGSQVGFMHWLQKDEDSPRGVFKPGTRVFWRESERRFEGTTHLRDHLNNLSSSTRHDRRMERWDYNYNDEGPDEHEGYDGLLN